MSVQVRIPGSGCNGVFVVNSQIDASGEQLYTRAGSFEQDFLGNLVNSAGFYLQGWALDSDQQVININQLSTVNVRVINGLAAATTNVELGANLDAGQAAFAGVYAAGDMAAYQASAGVTGVQPHLVRAVQVYDPLGGAHNLQLAFLKDAAANVWNVEIYADATEVETGDHPDGLLASGTVTFNGDGTRARSLVHQLKREENRQARELLAQAVKLAPGYAEAHVMLAEAEYRRALFGWVEWIDETLRAAEGHAQRALATEDTGAHARAHAMLAQIYAARGEYDQGLAEAERAIALNPSDVVALYARGEQLVWLGRTEEGVAVLETARRFDGGSFSGYGLALGYYMLGRYREALEAADLQIARSPEEHRMAVVIRTATFGQLGRQEEARDAAGQLRGMTLIRVDQIGTRFRNPEDTLKFQAGLRKAGFD